MPPFVFPLLPSAPANLAVPRICLVEYVASCIDRAKWLTLSGPSLSLPSWAEAFYWFSSSSAAWALAPPHYHYLLRDASLPLIKIYIPHSLGDTILSTESAVAAAASLSPRLTPASPVLVPVRDFQFKLNFNAAALMFKVELPSQEVAEDRESIVTYLSILGTPSKMSLENTLFLQGIEEQHSGTGTYFIFWLE